MFHYIGWFLSSLIYAVRHSASQPAIEEERRKDERKEAERKEYNKMLDKMEAERSAEQRKRWENPS